jgi:replication-associated recombination protein RarA
LVDDALYWAVDMYLTGYDEYAWKRLRIMASEDVGPAEPDLPATIAALYSTYTDLKKKKDDAHAPQRLQFVHAVILLATARKNRIVDHALIHHFGNHTALKRDIPDCALDKHTARGKRLGRGAEHFFAEGIKLANETGEDPYRELARQTLTAKPESTAEPADLFT